MIELETKQQDLEKIKQLIENFDEHVKLFKESEGRGDQFHMGYYKGINTACLLLTGNEIYFYKIKEFNKSD